jgi:hypothetical protein
VSCSSNCPSQTDLRAKPTLPQKIAWLLPLVLLLSGCIAQRGVDFGSFAGRAEDIPVIRVYNVNPGSYPPAGETILLLPPLGDLPGDFNIKLQLDFQEELQKYFNARVVSISPTGRLNAYVTEENLAPEKGFFDFGEIKRLGELMQTEYVFCVWVQELRPYPPQVLSLYAAILDTQEGSLVAELDATFNAAEQKVVVSLQDFLQRRRARQFDRNSLNMMLQSPSEFHLFVAAECSRALAMEMIPPETIKIRP